MAENSNLMNSIQSDESPQNDSQGLLILKDDQKDKQENLLPNTQRGKQRIYWVDWVRSIGIHIVTIVHCINHTNKAYGDETLFKDQVFEQQRQACYRFLVQFGMPVFFYISGMSAGFFNFEKDRPFLRFLQGKVRRLIVPLVLSIFFLLMPQLYIMQDWCDWYRLDDGKVIEHNYFMFMIRQLGDGFLFKLGALWFLLFLFMLMILNYPMIKWTSRRSRLLPFDREDKITIGQVVLFLLVWDRLAYLVQKSNEDYIKYILPNNLILGLMYATYFAIQWRLQTKWNDISANRFNGICGLYFVPMLFNILSCIFLPKSEDINLCAVTIQVCFHSSFFVQGLVVASWRETIQADWEHVKKSTVFVILVPLNLTMQAVILPGNHSLIASVYLYPIYSDVYLNMLFIVGAWVNLYTLLWMLKGHLNKEFRPKLFKITSESSLWCYISHSCFTYMFLTYFVVPFTDSMPFIVAFLLSFIFTEIMCIVSYLLLEKLQKKISERGERRQRVIAVNN